MEKSEYIDNGHERSENVGSLERLVSLLGGAAMAYRGLRRSTSFARVALAATGSFLIYRGTTGKCPLYSALGISTRQSEEAGVTVEKSITVQRPLEEVYRYWHDFTNLPRFMEHLESVDILDSRRSHWSARTPGGIKIEWNSEMTEEIENGYIGWRTLPGSDLMNEGSVRFKRAPKGGTEVKLRITYFPPGGTVGAAVAELLDQITSREIEKDLMRFRTILETGDTAGART